MGSFSNRRFRYGAFSTVMAAAAVGLFILVNLVADQFNVSHDLTREQLFSLSYESIVVARELEQPVTIYSLWQTGQEVFLYQQLLEEYTQHSNMITVINRDPILHPAFVESFAGEEAIAHGSVIVVGPNRHRVLHADELVIMDVDWNTGGFFIRSIEIEPLVTDAINYVVQEDRPIIYRMTGNNELEFPPGLLREFSRAGYEVRDVNLLTTDVPADADILFITMPERDWSPDQTERVANYLQNGGRAIFVMGYRPERFPRVDEVLASLGVRVGDYIIIEGSPAHFYRNFPTLLLPDFVPTEITMPLLERGFIPLVFQATGVDTLDLRRPSTVISPVMRSSAQSYGRIHPEEGTPISRIAEDIDGPFSLAVTAEDTVWGSRVVVVSSDSVLREDYNEEMGGTNWSFLVNSLNWLREEPPRVFIRGRTPPAATPLTMNTAQVGMVAFVSVVVLPLFFAIVGIVVWLRRRNA